MTLSRKGTSGGTFPWHPASRPAQAAARPAQAAARPAQAAQTLSSAAVLATGVRSPSFCWFFSEFSGLGRLGVRRVLLLPPPFFLSGWDVWEFPVPPFTFSSGALLCMPGSRPPPWFCQEFSGESHAFRAVERSQGTPKTVCCPGHAFFVSDTFNVGG